MKKLLLSTLLVIIGINTSVNAQWVSCLATSGTLSGTLSPIAMNENTSAPTYSINPSLLSEGFLVVLHDTLSIDTMNNVIIKGSDNGIVSPQSLNLNTGDTFSVVSFSYNIYQVRKLTHALLNNYVPFLGSCCAIVESQTAFPFCDSLNVYGIFDSTDVNTIEDVLNVVSIYRYGTRVYNSLSGLNNALQFMNLQMGTLNSIGCTDGVSEFCYAFDSLSSSHDNYIVNAIPNLVISEIMYNGPESGTDTTEFIEIYNNGSTTVDLTNYTMLGVTYTFPSVSLNPGAFYVLAVNAGAFNSVFGFMPDGVFTGALSNGGEPVALYNAAGNLVDSVNYDDVIPWPSGFAAGEPDGGGASLVLCDVNSDNNDGNNWSSSVASTGVIINGLEVLASPGAANFCCPVLTGTDTQVVCDSLLWMDGNTYYLDNTTATYTTQTTQGCDSIITLNLTINISPSDQTISAPQTSFCPGGGSTTVDLASSETGIKYYLRNDANDSVVAGPIIGTGNGISLNTGVVTSTTTYNVYAEGATPGALEFTGNAGLKKVSLGTNLYTDNIAGTTQLTVEAWIKRSSTGTLHTIFSNYEGSYPLLLRIDNDKLTFYINSSTNVQSTNTIPAGVWTHVAATYTGTQIMVYINGVLEGSQPYNLPFNSSSNELKIGGGLSANNEYFLGDIADVRVWDHARSDIQISNNMNQILTGSESGLIANYQFLEGSGSTTANSAVSGLYPGTLINNPAWVAGPLSSGANCSQEMSQLVTISVNDVTAPVPDVANLPDIVSCVAVDSLTTPTATDDCSGNTNLIILPPASSAGVNANVGVASFGPQTFYINAQSVIAQDITPDSLCCDTIINNYAGKIAVMYRGACSFALKVKNAQNAGAIGAIIVNNAGGTVVQDMAGTDPTIIIPAFMVSTDDGLALMSEINSGNVEVIMERKSPIIITHNATLPITTLGTTVVTWTYDDGNGNTSTQNQNVVIPDNTIDNSLTPTLTANQSGASYQWLDCDNGNAVIPGANGQSYTATANGNYAVEITMGSCVDTSACENITGVGLRELSQQEVRVYPNPTSGKFTIDLGENTNLVEYRVTTVEGRVVEQGRVTENKITIDLSEESKGIYFLKLGNSVYKVMKQ